ncbi:MAG: alginate lyase family protein [Armatimonadetes bacterium]|nr:alginate lyase family protein [Armatimonadota bacterium]
MRGSLVVLLIGSLWLAGDSSGTAAEGAHGPNLVPNGGFEADTAKPGFPDGWTFGIRGEDPLLKASLSPAAHSGRRSLCVTKALGRRGTALGSPTLSSSPMALKPRVTYEISAWMKIESPFPVDTVTLRMRTNTPGFRGQVGFDVKVTREWSRHTVALFTEADTTSGTLVFETLGDLSDRIYIDDVTVREAGAKAPPSDKSWHPPARAIYRTDLTGFAFPKGHPRVERTAAEIEEMKRGMAGHDTREHPWVRDAGEWLERPLYFFEEGSRAAPDGYQCPVDGAWLAPWAKADGSHGVTCPRCGKVYTTDAHKNRAREVITRNQAHGARVLARAYALTGDEHYGRKAAEIVVGFAHHYRQWGGGKRPTMYVLNECTMFIEPCVVAYDYLYDSGLLTPEQRRKIEEDFFRPAAQYYAPFADSNGRMNNRGAIYNSAILAIGAAMNDKELVDHALNSPYSGFHPMVAGMFDADGFSPEGMGYHTYTMSGLTPIAETAYRLGINVYHDPAYRKVFEAPLSVMLPGEEFQRSDYTVAVERFTEAGHLMEFPFGEDKVARACRLPSSNFREFGYGVLRTSEGADHIYVGMTYGPEAMWYGHEPNRQFSLVLYANGRAMTPRGRGPTYGDALAGWAVTALGNNAPTVDDMDHWGERSNSRLLAFETAPRVKVMRASNDAAYPGIALDRTLFLADGYAVDLASARAGHGEHRFDLIYRLFGKLSCDLPFQARKGALGAGSGYEDLTDVRSARTGEGWSADWRQPGDSALRLSLVGMPATEVNACTAPVNASSGEFADADQKETVDALLVRRWGRGTVFAAVWEPYRDRPGITWAMALPVEGGEARGVGVGVVKQGQPGSECFLASYAPGRRRFGDIELNGKLAAGRWRNPRAAPEYAHLINGVLLKRGPRSLEASKPATLYVEQLAPGRLLVKTGSASAGRLTLRRSPFIGRLPGPVTVERDGQAVQHTERRGAITFQVAADASYQVSGVTDWQSMRLANEAAAAPEPKPAALPDLTVRPEPGPEGPLTTDGTLAGKNKIANGGFEVNAETHPALATPWERRSSYYATKLGNRHRYDGEVARSGRYSLRIRGEQYYQATLRGLAEQRIAGSPAGKTYTFSAWVKASMEPTRVRLVLYGWNPKWGRDFEGGVSPEFTIGTEWQRFTWTRTFGPEITDAYAMIMRPYQIMGGDVWVDDAQLEEGAMATDFAPDAWSERVQKETPGTSR